MRTAFSNLLEGDHEALVVVTAQAVATAQAAAEQMLSPAVKAAGGSEACSEAMRTCHALLRGVTVILRNGICIVQRLEQQSTR